MTDFTSEVTYSPTERPGVSNLILLHSLCSGQSVNDVVKNAENLNTGQYKVCVHPGIPDLQ